MAVVHALQGLLWAVGLEVGKGLGKHLSHPCRGSVAWAPRVDVTVLPWGCREVEEKKKLWKVIALSLPNT